MGKCTSSQTDPAKLQPETVRSKKTHRIRIDVLRISDTFWRRSGEFTYEVHNEEMDTTMHSSEQQQGMGLIFHWERNYQLGSTLSMQ